LYTGTYAKLFSDNRDIIDKYISVSEYAYKSGIEINAGHDLDLENLSFFKKSIPNLYEVSIGHALICDSLSYGLEKTIKMYLDQLK
jgi:pyridoxine 5-phosphate synthase